MAEDQSQVGLTGMELKLRVQMRETRDLVNTVVQAAEDYTQGSVRIDPIKLTIAKAQLKKGFEALIGSIGGGKHG